MGETTAISWCDHTFNPWIGCTKVSPACDGCYAEALMDKRYGRVEWGAPGKGNGTRVRTSAGNWHQPIRWNKRAADLGTRPFVFCASLADVFDNQVPTAWRTDLLDLIRATPNLIWLLLTKRPQNIVRMHGAAFDLPWPRNAAIGTTVEDQDRADLNVPNLLQAKAELNPAFAFLSCEPLLGPVDLTLIPRGRTGNAPRRYIGHITKDELDELCRGVPTDFTPCTNALGGIVARSQGWPTIDWVITGGETDQGGHKARPTHPGWFRRLRDDCAASAVAFHHKQNGEWAETTPGETIWPFGTVPMAKVGKANSGRLLDGIEHNARPEVRP